MTLLDTRDVESIEALTKDGEVWPDLLTRKQTDLYRFLPFHNYLYRRFEGAVPKNDYLRDRWDRIAHMIGMRFFGEPLARPDNREDRRGRRRRQR